MYVSVIIPTLNEERHIGSAVESAHLAGADEVIVVDGHSEDRTTVLADDAGALVLHANRGRGNQQNVGAEEATGQVLLFLHADCILDGDCINQAIAAISDGHTHGAFKQRIQARGFAYRLLENGNGFRAGALGLPYGDQAIFVQRRAFFDAGGFPNLQIMEDWTLMKRLRKRGRPVLLPGPIYVSARRWQKYGIVRQTLNNWKLVWAVQRGANPDEVTDRYPAHDAQPETASPFMMPAEEAATGATPELTPAAPYPSDCTS